MHAPRNRDGFTIVEVLLALLLLSFTVMGFQAATGEIIHYAAQSDRQAVAVQMVENHLDLIRL
ncbi:MAG: prepilin-type N-terminal cleavage/methylation domain-containing protein, partial [Gemmatimonadota bacterium]